MKRIFALTLALFLCAGFVLPLAAITPKNENIAAAVEAVRGAVGIDTPGAAVVLFENGERILYEGYGYADIEKRSLVTVETSFEIGKLSAVFISLAAQKLADEGKLSLKADICEYLPRDFADKLKLKHAVSMEDLLLGCAGFSERYFDLRYERSSLCFDTLSEALLVEVPAQTVTPKTYYSYSPFGLALAAYVIECVTGEPYADYVTAQILAPVGMTHTVLDPRADTAVDSPATGHVKDADGSFAAVKNGGRSYGALWPVDGALSNAADLALLLDLLLRDDRYTDVISAAAREKALNSVYQNGIFTTGAAGFSVCGTVRATQGSTRYFGASLAIDRTAGEAALVLSNTVDSALLSLPCQLLSFVYGSVPGNIDPGASLPALDVFEGEYPSATNSDPMLVTHARKALAVKATEDGLLQIGDRSFVQIAPGVFADAEKGDGVAYWQFLLSIDGDVIALLDAEGNAYQKASFFEKNTVKSVLYAALWIGCLYFILGAVAAVADNALSRRAQERRPKPLRFLFPWLLAALHSLFALLQLLFAQGRVASVPASFFSATSVVAMLAAVGAAACFAFALFTAFTKRGLTARVARSGIIYVFFVILCVYWGILTL